MRRYQAITAALVVLAGVAASGLVGAPSGAAPSAAGRPTPTAAPPPVTCASVAEVQAWPLARQVGHLVMVGVPILQSTRSAAAVAQFGLAGILIRGTPGPDTAKRIAAIRAAGLPGTPPIVAVDEEGGRVQHLKRAVGAVPSAAVMGATSNPEQVRALAAKHARGMRALGFTMDLGPVVDLANGDGNGIGDRAWSADPTVTSRFALAFARGLMDGGIVPVLKHFPGHGHASGDSHDVGATTPPIDVLRQSDLLPFRDGATVAGIGVMVAHLQVPGLDTLPASLSPAAVNGVLRTELHHRGLVITDSLSMWPIRFHFPAPRAAELALKAGNDILLFDDEPDVAAIVSALVNVVTAEPELHAQVTAANLRILAAVGRPTCAPDVAALDLPATIAPTAPTTTPPTTGASTAG